MSTGGDRERLDRGEEVASRCRYGDRTGDGFVLPGRPSIPGQIRTGVKLPTHLSHLSFAKSRSQSEETKIE